MDYNLEEKMQRRQSTMSNTYLAGEQTKRKIFKESKKLFYKNGFDETTYDEISSAAKINRALIPYHFKTKQILGEEIYLEFINEFTAALNSILEIDQFSPELIGVIHTVAYYRLFNHPRYCRFVFQLLSDKDFSGSLSENQTILTECLGSKASRFTPAELDILRKMSAGMEKEIIRMIYTAKDTPDIDYLVRIKLHMLLGYTGYSKRKIDELLDASVTLLDLLSFRIKNSFAVEITYK
ncbi:MAG: TetR family transcriptional regulator [Bacteroidales bacterium]|nr:TetR family transcriptional regulator [Clostridium sp.]MCM1203876.1 TetR family transcriptional regulator [Bacteroidales bacterium]